MISKVEKWHPHFKEWLQYASSASNMGESVSLTE